MTSTAGASSKSHKPGGQESSSSHPEQDDNSSDAVPEEEEAAEKDNKQRLVQISKDENRNWNDRSLVEAITEIEAAQSNEEATLPPELGDGALQSEASSNSGLDNTPSIQGSLKSSPGNSIAASRTSRRSSYNASPSSTPFERRFKARITSASNVPRAISPAFLTAHSRQSSTSSQLTLRSQEDDNQDPSEDRKPWEVIRWTKLKKISQQAFSESGKRAFGDPTFLCIGPSIAIGTSKGIILFFDYQQTLKNIIGQGTAAAECGSITSLAVSADHSTVAAGHANGSIFTWDLSRPATPFLRISPISRTHLQNRTSEGHVADCAILHIGFLGQRRTALVSADDSGMAFSHLASRGLGPVTRTVKTTRILGRYPVPSSTLRKPSSVLGFAALPLGNVQQATDYIGLTALLTPYLLVLISTTPIAQTQYKFPRPNDISAHSALTGCLAWFPAVTLKTPSKSEPGDVSNTKLVYCWSNLLYVLEVREKANTDPDQTDKQREFEFKPRGRWVSDEAILAVQWLGRSVIALLTITQRLVILEASNLRLTDSSDLISKHIHHQDVFSRQLQPLVDKMVHGDDSLHGVLPDAYHMSFKAYKGRLFLLGVNDLSMGTLSNWADRLMAMLIAGNPIAAIELATSYYVGDADKISIGLPNDKLRRHAIVKEKLLELMSSALQHIINDETARDTEHGLRSALEDFARVSFTACVKSDEISFLFDQAYEQYSELAMQDIFLHELETYILNGTIDLVPPEVLQDILMWYEGHDMGLQLAEILCSLQPATMDIERVTNVCRRMRLYDALIHVWNEAADDFVSPLIDLLSLIRATEQVGLVVEKQAEERAEDATKIFPYLAYTLTGRSYPDGIEMIQQRQTNAKSSLHGFLFSPKITRWPQPNGELVSIGRGEVSQSTYPYLRELLDFDSFSFLTMLNEAFEDSFLNREQNQLVNGSTVHDNAGVSMTRQKIVSILLEVIKPPDYDKQDKVLLDIFLARNLAKFHHEDVLLSDSILDQILSELCTNPVKDLIEECQLSVEYLLTVHQPHEVDHLIALLNEAGFYRVLKSTYRRGKQYAKWLDTHFRDMDDREAVFSCISECLRPNSGLSKRQIASVKTVIGDHGRDLIDINASRTATTLEVFAPDLLESVFANVEEDSHTKYIFLKAIYEHAHQKQSSDHRFSREHQEEFIVVMCRYDPGRVSDYVSSLESGSLRLDRIMPALESSGVVDAAVILLQHDDLAREAVDRLIKHLKTLKTALAGLLKTVGEASPDHNNTQEAIDDLLQSLGKYVKLGIWLCQGEVGKSQPIPPQKHQSKRPFQYTEDDLTLVELLWLDLIDATISLSSALPLPQTKQHQDPTSRGPHDYFLNTLATTTDTLRNLVQTTFTALLVSSSNSNTPSSSKQDTTSPHLERIPTGSTTPRFPAILSALLTRLSSTTPTGTILPLLSNLLTSYAFEASILSLTRHFLDKDVFALVAAADAARRRGWRPAARACDVCGRRCWGPGAGVGNWEAWRERRESRGREGRRVYEERERSEASRRRKGKGRVVDVGGEGEKERGELDGGDVDALVVFKCQHLFHRRCLEGALGKTDADVDVVVEYRCPLE